MERTMEKKLGLLVCSALLFPAWLPAQSTAAQSPETREAQYVALQAGLFDEQGLTALPDAVDKIERMLREIRSRVPAVAELRIPSQMLVRTSVIVLLEPSLRRNVDRMCDAWEGYARARSNAIGVAEIDAITQKFGGAYEVTCRSRGTALGSHVVVNFPRMLHVDSLAGLYAKARGVTSAENDRVILGGVMPVAVEKLDDQWRVTFGRGAGDCPAGCTYREYYRFLVAADGTIEYLGSEQQGELPATVIEEDPPEEEAVPQ